MQRRKFLKALPLGAATATLAAPAIAQSRRTMEIVSTWPRDFPAIGTGAQRLAQRIEELSDGRIVAQYFAAGERVGAFDAFDEVTSGNVQAYTGAEFYWKGKHPAFAAFTSVPFGLVSNEMNAWTKHGGGQELWDELAGEFGLKSLACGNTAMQMGGWFRNEVNSVEDFKGLRMRIPGLGGDVMARLGVSTISVPGGQIYENLVSGSIDAAKWVGPYLDYFMRFHEAARYYYSPGFQEPGSQLSLGMNASWWGSLDAWEQGIIKAACDEQLVTVTSEINRNNSVYLERLVNEHGVELREFNLDILKAFAAAADEVIGEAREHSDLSRRVFDSLLNARREIGAWTEIADASFVKLRTAVTG